MGFDKNNLTAKKLWEFFVENFPLRQIFFFSGEKYSGEKHFVVFYPAGSEDPLKGLNFSNVWGKFLQGNIFEGFFYGGDGSGLGVLVKQVES
ncbi:MAG: hypothetical protein CM15mP58_13150 [Burkholderiaceae bacterium]|nr:MAG: hypothetical protein CM15mP58_13150 [Burkholderiaceae bacterium]